MAEDVRAAGIEFPSGTHSKVFQQMFDWWVALCADLGRLPARSDVRPEEFPPGCLPHVILTEIAPNAAKMRFLLLGGAHESFNRRNFKGLELAQAQDDPAKLAYVQELYRVLQAARRPLWNVANTLHPRTGQHLIVRRLGLPLSSNGVDVDFSLNLQTFEPAGVPSADDVARWMARPESGELQRCFL